MTTAGTSPRAHALRAANMAQIALLDALGIELSDSRISPALIRANASQAVADTERR